MGPSGGSVRPHPVEVAVRFGVDPITKRLSKRTKVGLRNAPPMPQRQDRSLSGLGPTVDAASYFSGPDTLRSPISSASSALVRHIRRDEPARARWHAHRPVTVSGHRDEPDAPCPGRARASRQRLRISRASLTMLGRPRQAAVLRSGAARGRQRAAT